MDNYFKGALKVFVGYCTVLLIFVIFLITVLSLAKDNLGPWLSIYSFVNFLLLFLIIYSDMKKLAIKEKRPQYNLDPYPFKGFVYGAIGFLPFIAIQMIYPFLNFNDALFDRIKYLALNTLLGPLFVFIKLGGKTALSHIAASSLVPIVSMLGYMAGFYGFELRRNPGNQNKNATTIKK